MSDEQTPEQKPDQPRTLISTRTLLFLGIAFVVFGLIMVIFFPNS